MGIDPLCDVVRSEEGECGRGSRLAGRETETPHLPQISDKQTSHDITCLSHGDHMTLT